MHTPQAMNPYSDDYAKASEHLRQAIALLSKHQIPPSPLNYRISYDIAAGRNLELEQELDAQLEQTAAPSTDKLWHLYAKHFIHEDQALDKLRDELKLVITTMQNEFSQAGSNIADYANNLNEFCSILDNESSLNRITEKVREVLEDTRDIEQSHVRLESHMTHVVHEMEEMRRELEQVKQESLTDSLTGIYNRKAFDSALASTIQNAQQTESSTCLLLADIDHFKKFNDTHGHLVGDKVLRFVATTLKQCIKGQDTAARFGGEEFAIILPNTDLTGAQHAAEQIRKAISSGKLVNKSKNQSYGTITVSIGISQLQANDDSYGLIQRADQSLYLAKDRGRNRVEYSGAA